jgi:cupin fold WbuC family metalloprotein
MSERDPAQAVVLFGAVDFDALQERALSTPRLRTNHNFHLGDDDPSHRFLNVLARGTYIPPHRHTAPPKSEAFVILRGEIAFFTFDDEGAVTAAHRLAAGDPTLPCGIDILPGVWHAITALSETAVCYEVKPGPYTPFGDKVIAPFAPPEGDARAPMYLASLLAKL